MDRRWWRRFGAFSVLLGATSCTTTCRACVLGVTVAEDPGPPRTTLLWERTVDDRYDLGRLHIDAASWRSLILCHEKPVTGAVAVEPGGKRIAARCNQGPWNVIELGAEGRTFVFCRLEDDPTKDWKKAPSVETHGTDVIACNSPNDTLTSLMAEMRSRGTDARGLADYLLRAASYGGKATSRDSFANTWLEEYAALEPAARKRLDDEMCRALRRKDTEKAVADLAIRICPLDDEGVIDALLGHVQALANDDAARTEYDLLWYGGILATMRAKPAEVGAAVCASEVRGNELEQSVMGYLETKCPEAPPKRPPTCTGKAIDRWLSAQTPRESPRLDCDAPSDE